MSVRLNVVVLFLLVSGLGLMHLSQPQILSAAIFQDGDQAGPLFCEYLPPAGVSNGKTLVLLSGDEEYRSEELMPMLAKVLSQHHGFHCYVLFAINPETGEIDPNNQANLPGLHLLEKADLVIMAWRFRNPPDDSMKHFVDYYESGRPIIALRTSTHAFKFDQQSTYHRYSFDSRAWPGGFGKQVLGETWVSHHGKHGLESTRGIAADEFADHPILKGVETVWGPSDVYEVGKLPDDAQVIMKGQILAGMQPDSAPVTDQRNDPMMPLIWLREVSSPDQDRTQRLVVSTIGAATDFQVGDLTRLMVNSVYWCLEWEDRIKPDSSVEPLDPFEPTAFGFNTFQPGKLPSDYALKNKPE